MKIAKKPFLLFFLLSCHFFAPAQSSSEMTSQRKVFPKADRPNLSIEFSKIGRFRIATRKSVYRMGEIITVVGAIINTTGQKLFLRKLDSDFRLFNEKGQKLKIETLFTIDEFLTDRSFELTEPGQIRIKPFDFFVGDYDKTEELIKAADTEDEKEIFERDYFALYTGMCLKIKQPGIYIIKAIEKNEHVVDLADESGVKTATGRIESNAITIKIIK